jgi:hypothetical protein
MTVRNAGCERYSASYVVLYCADSCTYAVTGTSALTLGARWIARIWPEVTTKDTCSLPPQRT